MAIARKRLQGIRNIIYFNWHFYVLFGILFSLGIVLLMYIESHLFQVGIMVALIFGTYSLLVSLIVSMYVYDFTDVYQLPWISEDKSFLRILNIHAGFDETSPVIQLKRPNSKITICDFYQPTKHTEISIERARKKYPQPNAIVIQTSLLPFENQSMDEVYVIFAAHEIRDNSEREVFFKEIYRVLVPCGTVYITEHERGLANSLAYTFGVFHFFTEKTWHSNFNRSQLKQEETYFYTPFITTYKLQKDGTTP
jgi:SAM-dependent methyltransferase